MNNDDIYREFLRSTEDPAPSPPIGQVAAPDPVEVQAKALAALGLTLVCGGDKLDHGSGGFSCRGRIKTLPPVAFDLFGDGRWEDVHRGSLFTSSACLSC
jgi:hypothetical protein